MTARRAEAAFTVAGAAWGLGCGMALATLDSYNDMQKDLADVEDQIQLARRYYNGTVRDYNVMIQQFPSNLVANWGGFTSAPFFQADETDRAVPKVSFQT